MGTSLTQFGITWTFDKELSLDGVGDTYQYGQFANNDYWVLGPANITNIFPGVDVVSYTENEITYDRTENGSMINPVVTNSNGFDSHTVNNYDLATNAGIGISSETPLVLGINESLLTSISRDPTTASYQTHIDTLAILTCLETVPTSGAFRPAYCGSVKDTTLNESMIDYSLLQTLEPTASTPDITAIAETFERPWNDFYASWTGRYIHPFLNMPEYGRDIAGALSVGALMVHLNYTNEQKRDLVVRLIQIGIDLYAIYLENFYWYPDGGHMLGRKWPILFAGLMLNNSAMKSIGDSEDLFQEDGQSFYVAQEDVDATNSVDWNPDDRDDEFVPYEVSDIGMPEWGIRHSTDIYRSNKYWQTAYRVGANASSWNGVDLSTLLFQGGKELWNNNAFFDFTDRYMAITNGDPDPFGYTVLGEEKGGRSWDSFTEEMWDTYRNFTIKKYFAFTI